MQKDTLQPGLPIPDEASAKQHCLCTGVGVPDLATVKDFPRFYIATSRGKIDENERPTVDSVNTFAEWFFAGFTRIEVIFLPEQYRLHTIQYQMIWSPGTRSARV
jgi:hypothetical protein